MILDGLDQFSYLDSYESDVKERSWRFYADLVVRRETPVVHEPSRMSYPDAEACQNIESVGCFVGMTELPLTESIPCLLYTSPSPRDS